MIANTFLPPSYTASCNMNDNEAVQPSGVSSSSSFPVASGGAGVYPYLMECMMPPPSSPTTTMISLFNTVEDAIFCSTTNADRKRGLSAIEPTPIGPRTSVNVVDKIPVESIFYHDQQRRRQDEHQDHDFNTELLIVLDALQPAGVESQHNNKRRKMNHNDSAPSPNFYVSSSLGDDSSTTFDLHNPQVEMMVPNATSLFDVVDSMCISPTPKQQHQQQEDLKKKPSTTTAKATPTTIGKKHDKWCRKYDELVAFHKTHGHCLVPVTMSEEGDSYVLSQWVKRQRHQLKLKRAGRHSTLTDDREAALQRLGFVWDSHEAIWNERFEELLEFKRTHGGHCNVPTKFPENPQLSIWVKCQRRQYKLYLTGNKSTINTARIAKLTNVGFDWNPRNLRLD